MARWNVFSSENLLMSVGGHLVVAALLVASVSLVIERAQLVAPDRIEIIEIDLDNVKVSGDETRLYNTNAPVEEEALPAPEKNPEPKPEPEPVEEPVKIETPTLVEEEPEKKPEPEPEPEKKQDIKVEEKTAPKKKTVVRVKRETVSLDRTLTISVVDALRVAMTRCWVIDTSRPDIADIRAVVHLTMRKNGTVRDVWFESAARADTDPAFAYVLETIRNAINVCQPLKMLPENEFSKWEKIQLTFYPNQGKVM